MKNFLKKVHINLLPCLEPVHHMVYAVPCIHEKNFKNELQHMIDIRIFK